MNQPEQPPAIPSHLLARRFAEYLAMIGIAAPTLTVRDRARRDLRRDYET